MIGDYLGEKEDFALKVMYAYVDSYNFQGMEFPRQKNIDAIKVLLLFYYLLLFQTLLGIEMFKVVLNLLMNMRRTSVYLYLGPREVMKVP